MSRSFGNIAKFFSLIVPLSEWERRDKQNAELYFRDLKKATSATLKTIIDTDDATTKSALLDRHLFEVLTEIRRLESIDRTLQEREVKLLKFAMMATENFFDFLEDNLNAYFDTKKNIVIQKLDERGDWSTGLKDTGRKALGFVEIAAKQLNTVAKAVGYESTIGNREFNKSTLIESVLEETIPRDKIAKDIEIIIQAAYGHFRETWKTEIELQEIGLKADVQDLWNTTDVGEIPYEFGKAETILGVGFASALAGTFGLAAGWHTLSYALMNVFPPLAIFAVVATAVVAVRTEESSKEKRRELANKLIFDINRQVLLQIDLQKFESLDDQTFRSAATKMSLDIVKATSKSWRDVIGCPDPDILEDLMGGYRKHQELVREYQAKLV